MTIDISTLLLCDTLVVAFLGAVLLFYETTRKTYPGFKAWAAGTFVLAFGYLSLLLRGTMPAGISISLANACFVLAAILRLDGALRFTSDRGLNKALYAAPVIVMASSAYLHLVHDDIALRNLLTSTIIALSAFTAGREFIRKAPGHGRILYRVAGAFYLLFGTGLLLRAVAWFVRPVHGLFEPGILQAGLFLLASVFEAGWGISFLLMNSQRVESELLTAVGDLKKAISRAKALSGLLPICSSCKKIRDEKGDWRQMECYIRDHSEAEFTHGICPDCSKRLYPEYQ